MDAQVIAEIVSAWTGIPLGRMVNDEIRTVLELQPLLAERVIGQDHAPVSYTHLDVYKRQLLDDNASQEQKAQFPLREASVQVAEVPGRPGVFRAVAFLRPHFQLDELSISLRLVAELPAQAQKS